MVRIVEHLIAEIERSRDMPTALEVLAETLQPFGFHRVDYGYVEQPWTLARGPKPISLLHHNFPNGWDNLWQRFASHDPIYLTSLESTVPVDLTEVRATRNVGGLEIDAWRCLDDLGLSTAIVVPTHFPQGRFANVGAYWDPDRPLAEWKHVMSTHQDLLFVIGHYFCDTMDRKFFRRNVQQDAPTLTRREVECLSWIACGKSNKEIAAIIGIARATVRFHLENAMHKLGARNRTGAVAAAYSRGWLKAH
jgi:LuxR family transcriptional regulator, quorum-sensing system regulator SdiA